MSKAFENSYSACTNTLASRSTGGASGIKILFAWLAILMGISLFAWTFYNRFIEQQPEFTSDFPHRGPFGISVLMIVVGVRWLRRTQQR